MVSVAGVEEEEVVGAAEIAAAALFVPSMSGLKK